MAPESRRGIVEDHWVCTACGLEQPEQRTGRPRTRCVACRAPRPVCPPGRTVRSGPCRVDGCEYKALAGVLCPFHAATERALSAARCERGCGRAVFAGSLCVIHRRARYHRYLPPLLPGQAEEEIQGRWFRRFRVWRLIRHQYGRPGKALAPVYRTSGASNASLTELLAVFWEGQCHLCGGPVDMVAPNGDPLALTIDHLRPRAEGGKHHVSNLAPAHLVCNMAKGNRPTERSLRVQEPYGALRGRRKPYVNKRNSAYRRRAGYGRRWS